MLHDICGSILHTSLISPHPPRQASPIPTIERRVGIEAGWGRQGVGDKFDFILIVI